MSHYEVKFDNDQDALDECKQFWGDEQYKLITGMLARFDDHASIGQVRVALMMQGVQGFPVNALIRAYMPKLAVTL